MRRGAGDGIVGWMRCDDGCSSVGEGAALTKADLTLEIADHTSAIAALPRLKLALH